jgi:hypothetical protein
VAPHPRSEGHGAQGPAPGVGSLEEPRAGSDRLAIGLWPNNPRALAGRLRRTQTFLRAVGIEIAFGREGRAGTRIITIHAAQKNPPRGQSREIVRTVSSVSTDGLRPGST